MPNGSPTRRKQPRCWKYGEKQHQSPVSSGNLANCPVTAAVHITGYGIEVTEARNDVIIRRPAVAMRRRPAHRFLAVDSLLEQDLAEARQHSTRSSLRDAGRPARKLEGGAVRPPGALITIGYRTTRHLIVNPITSRPGCRHPSRQKARQCRHNGEKAPLHSIMTPLSSVGSWQTHLYESRQGQRAEHAVARFWPAVAASEPYGIKVCVEGADLHVVQQGPFEAG